MALETQTVKTVEKANIAHTVYGQALMAANSLGLPYPILENSTLNELFGVNPDLKPAVGEIPRIGYFTLGCGAHDFVKESGKPSKPEIYKHSPEDAGMYKPFPFVLRRLNDDLPADMRAKYALRRKENHNGIDYIAYYAKRLELAKSEIQILRDQVTDGVTTTTPFKPTSANLNPVRPELPSTGLTVASNVKLRNNVEFFVEFTAGDVAEILNAADIIYGEEGYAVISEIGLCSGIDRQVSSTTSGSAVRYTEVIACQIAAFFSTFKMMTETNGGFIISFEMGSRIPLAAASDLDATAYYNRPGSP